MKLGCCTRRCAHPCCSPFERHPAAPARTCSGPPTHLRTHAGLALASGPSLHNPARCCQHREKAQLGLLLHALRAAVPAPFARLPAAPALLFAEASVALAGPTGALFGPLNKLLLRGSPPDLTVRGSHLG